MKASFLVCNNLVDMCAGGHAIYELRKTSFGDGRCTAALRHKGNAGIHFVSQIVPPRKRPPVDDGNKHAIYIPMIAEI